MSVPTAAKPRIVSGWGGAGPARVADVSRPLDEEHLSLVLRQAADNGQQVALRGCGHATAGQSYARNALMIDVRGLGRVLEIDETERTIRVQGGATWDGVTRQLELHGLGLTTQQEFHSFTVGGSLAANAHGKSIDHGPFSTAVRELRLLTADGSVVRCSREENRDLLYAVIGGHGLLGVVLDATLELVDDPVVVRADRVSGDRGELLNRYLQHVRRRAQETPLCYGFLDAGLRHGHYVAYARDDAARRDGALERHEVKPALFDRFVAAQRRSALVRRLTLPVMWHASRANETTLRSRRLLLWDQPPASLAGTQLQKFIVPAHAFDSFCAAAGPLLERDARLPQFPPHFRFVPGPDPALLPLAPEDSVCLVLCHFADPRDPAWVQAYERLTRDLVDLAVAAGGRHYLTFGAAATRDQLLRAYSGWDAFVAQKRAVDPDHRFTSEFFRRYEEEV